MAPKTKRSRGSSSQAFDCNRFVSVAAQERHRKSLVTRMPIPERGFASDYHNLTRFHNLIRFRNWEQFCSQPSAAVIPIVREFYANATESEHYRVMVRERIVKFDRSTINKYFKLQDIENDDYSVMDCEFINLSNIITNLTDRTATWKFHNGEAVSFPTRALTVTAKMWFYFICSNLMPSTHLSDVTRDRAILLYFILQKKSIDIGQFLSQTMQANAKHPRESLWFPCLITGLCTQAGVVWEEGEEILQPKGELDMTTLQRFEAQEEKRNPDPDKSRQTGPGSSSSATTSAPSLSTLTNQFHEFVEYQVRSNQALAQMMHFTASGIAQLVPGLDLSTCPHLPQPPNWFQGGTEPISAEGEDAEEEEELMGNDDNE